MAIRLQAVCFPAHTFLLKIINTFIRWLTCYVMVYGERKGLLHSCIASFRSPG